MNRVLVANRGEIAIRVMRACREMGIVSVAVYSDADKDSLPVRLADESVHIGPPLSRKSYLDRDKIIRAALTTGAGAIHPGYGFLSEDPAFARACASNDLVFIGPSAECIAMAGKMQMIRLSMMEFRPVMLKVLWVLIRIAKLDAWGMEIVLRSASLMQLK